MENTARKLVIKEHGVEILKVKPEITFKMILKAFIKKKIHMSHRKQRIIVDSIASLAIALTAISFIIIFFAIGIL